MTFRPRHVVVVGASGGLGRAIVRELSRQGIRVTAAGRRPPDEPVARFLPVDARSADWAADIGRAEADAVLVDGVVFVSGAAVFGRTAQIPSDLARETFELNFWACARAAVAAAEHWAATGRAGVFLALLSIAGRRAVPHEAYYGASKAAAARFLETLQLDYDPGQIRILAAYPGFVETGFRGRAPWFGAEPGASPAGTSPQAVARAVIDLLAGRRRSRVIGWRERAIDLSDRAFPGLYDGLVLRPRLRRARGAKRRG
jgi:short-subunit dehydrogenase